MTMIFVNIKLNKAHLEKRLYGLLIARIVERKQLNGLTDDEIFLNLMMLIL